jgi:hypothetical protein
VILSENGFTDAGAEALGGAASTSLGALRDLNVAATDMLAPPRTNKIGAARCGVHRDERLVQRSAQPARLAERRGRAARELTKTNQIKSL